MNPKSRQTNYLDNPKYRLAAEQGEGFIERYELETGSIPEDSRVAAYVLQEHYLTRNQRLRDAGRFMSVLLAELADSAPLES